MISITIKGMDKLRLTGKAFAVMRPAVTQAIDLKMRLFGQATVDRAKSQYLSGRPGLQPQSGRLRSSINYQVGGDDAKKEMRIGTNLIYGRIHEYGGTIVPKRSRFLVFSVGGKKIFTKQVTIPKRPYLQPSLEAETPIFAKALQQTLRDVVINGMRKTNE